MYRISIDFHKKLMQGEIPVPYIVINTHMGSRSYAEKELGAVFDLNGHLADGSVMADGSEIAGGGGSGSLEKSARVISFGNFERSQQTINETVLNSYQSKTLQSMTIEMDNADGYLSKLIASEPFIGRPIKYFVGLESLPQAEHLQVFSGIITEMDVINTMTIEANEE